MGTYFYLDTDEETEDEEKASKAGGAAAGAGAAAGNALGTVPKRDRTKKLMGKASAKGGKDKKLDEMDMVNSMGPLVEKDRGDEEEKDKPKGKGGAGAPSAKPTAPSVRFSFLSLSFLICFP
jgi:hypothetical protein